MPLTDTALAAVMYTPGAVIPANLKQIAAILYGGTAVIPANLLQLALANRGATLATGQTTQYSSELDDGYYQKGLAKAYTVLTAGQYASTTNIDLAHYAGGAGAIAFDNVAKTITDTGNGLAIFKTNDVITTDDPNNPGPFTVTTGNVAGTITCTGATFVTGTPAGVVTIKKREAHSNACVLDNNTGLMWSRTVSDKVGAGSTGNFPWTGQLYDVFAYAAAANAASLSGYSDWRVPNINELLGIIDWSQNPRIPDATAWPSFPATYGPWSSTVDAVTTANRLYLELDTAAPLATQATNQTTMALLVRGG